MVAKHPIYILNCKGKNRVENADLSNEIIVETIRLVQGLYSK